MIFVLVVLFVVQRFGRARSTRSDFYAMERGLSAPRNGLALVGAFLMLASFLDVSGEIALGGYDGVLLAVGLAVSWSVALLLVAEPLRNTGGYTLGDVLSVRMRERPVRVAAATVTLTVFALTMTAQMVTAGGLMAPVLGFGGPSGGLLAVGTIGGLAAVIVYYGGMRGTTWTQMIKAVLLLAAVVLLSAALLAHYRFNVSELFGAAAKAGTPRPSSGTHRLDALSRLLTTVLGYAALPYLFVRFLTVPDARRARRSACWAVWLVTPYSLLVVLIGAGAAALVPPERILDSPGRRLSAAPLLALELGGVPLLSFVASAVFITVVAVAAGLVLSAATSLTRDVYATVVRRGEVDEEREIGAARLAVVVLCVLVSGGAVLLAGRDVAFLVPLGVAVVASSVLPALVLSWSWRGFTTAGVLWSLYGGGAVTLVLAAFSPAVSGDPAALFPGADFAWFPLRNVGLVSVPVGFLLGGLGAAAARRGGRGDAAAGYAEAQVRALTGAGTVDTARPPTDQCEP